MPELTPEAIEEFIRVSQALQQRPVSPMAPPQMQFVTGEVEEAPPVAVAPPVRPPIPDWARHATMGPPRGAGVVSSFDPTTGQRSMSFGSSVPTQVDPLEDIRKQINAVQFKTAQEALDAATQFQALRAYQRDLEAGKDPTRWLPLLFKKNPTVIPGMMREKRLSAPPGITNINGYDVLTGGGGAARVIPPRGASSAVSIKAIPIILPDGSEDPDNYAVPSHTGRGFTIHSKKAKVTGPSISARQTFYKSKIDDIDTALRKLDFAEPPPPDAEAQRTALKNQRATFQKEWDDMMQPKGKAASAPAAPSEPKKLTKELARQFLTEAGGDKEKARKLAKDRGYEP